MVLLDTLEHLLRIHQVINLALGPVHLEAVDDGLTPVETATVVSLHRVGVGGLLNAVRVATFVEQGSCGLFIIGTTIFLTELIYETKAAIETLSVAFRRCGWHRQLAHLFTTLVIILV